MLRIEELILYRDEEGAPLRKLARLQEQILSMDPLTCPREEKAALTSAYSCLMQEMIFRAAGCHVALK